MNERTKELYKQAVDYACESADPNNGWKNGKDFTENTNEKFAELIVRECAGMFEGVYTDQTWPERIDKRIKQHFGVE